jgi:glycosyltransferase involved in cell wall biosynthesis
MNIGINASLLTNSKMDGITRFSIGIIEELYAKYPELYIYSRYQSFNFGLDQKNRVRDIKGIIEDNSILENASRIFWNQYVLSKAAEKDSISSVFSSAPEGTTNPKFNQYITIHDLIPIIYPDSSPRLKYYYIYFLPNLIKASKGIFVASHSTKNDLLKFYKVDPEKICVIHQGYNEKLFRTLTPFENIILGERHKVETSLDVSLPFILCVAESRPYKNLSRLIIAFSRLQKNNLRLVIVGNRSKLSGDLEDMPNKLGISNRVFFTGRISDDELVFLYNKATAFVFPSLYEGFGIPPLEAMACGCPTIVSNASSLPEVCGDAVIYFNPEDTNSISKSIANLIDDEALLQKLSFKGRERAKNFRYSNAADKILETICSN